MMQSQICCPQQISAVNTVNGLKIWRKKKDKDLLNPTSVCALGKQQPTTPALTSTSCRTENKCTGRFKIQHARHDGARAVLINHY